MGEFDLIGRLVHVLALLSSCAVILWITGMMATWISKRLQCRREEWKVEFVRGRINLLDRFCSQEFPIVADICENLRPALDGESGELMAEFRDRMRAKYGLESGEHDLRTPTKIREYPQKELYE